MPMKQTPKLVRQASILWFTAASQLLALPALAVPSLAEQTGLPCTVCHTQAFGPGLTSYGREFKLRGYVDGAGTHPLFAPLSAMMVSVADAHG